MRRERRQASARIREVQGSVYTQRLFPFLSLVVLNGVCLCVWLIVVVHDKVFIQWVIYSMDAVYPQLGIPNRSARASAAGCVRCKVCMAGEVHAGVTQ